MQNDPRSKGADWSAFLQLTKANPPSRTATEAVANVSAKLSALDLGAGGLRDTRSFLAEGFQEITVVDTEPDVAKAVAELNDVRVHSVTAPFDAFEYGEDRFDLINAHYALPFNPPATFDSVMEKIKKALKVGGVFSGQLFGDQDEWNIPGAAMTFHFEKKARSYFSDMEIIRFDPVIWDGKTAAGKPKHWHVYNIIAKKI